MSAAVVHQPRTMLPKFTLVLAAGAAVLSIIAITDTFGSNTAATTRAAPAVTVHAQAPGAGTARPQHAVVVTAAAAARTPAVGGRLMDESRLVNEVGTKVTAVAAAHSPGFGRRLMDESRLVNEIGTKVTAASQAPGFGRRLMDEIGPSGRVQLASSGAVSCGLKINTSC